MPENSYELKQKLGEAFRVEQCPMLIIIDPEGNVVTTEGVEIVNKDSEGECFPWTPKPLYDLCTLEPEILGEMNDTVTCVVLCEGCDKETKAILHEQMLPVASEYFEEAKASGCEAGMLFFTATESNEVVQQLRMSCELGEPTSTPQMVHPLCAFTPQLIRILCLAHTGVSNVRSRGLDGPNGSSPCRHSEMRVLLLFLAGLALVAPREHPFTWRKTRWPRHKRIPTWLC